MAGNLCSEQYHQLQQYHDTLNTYKLHQQYMPSPPLTPKQSHQLQEVNISPRKNLSRRSTASSDHLMPDSPDSIAAALMHKFLGRGGIAGNNRNGSSKVDDEFVDTESDPYSSDEFRMFEFKIRKCTRSRSHDWTDCPFAHPGEKARRRDPRKYCYAGTICADYRRGKCSKGDDCEFSHGVFECWLHPSRYRTEACKDGRNCKRKVCFFAHTTREIRLLPPQEDHESTVNGCKNRREHQEQQQYGCKHCCGSLHSPTSTLIGMSADHFSSSSPPMSPSLLSSSPPFSPAMTRRGGLMTTGFSRPVAVPVSPSASGYADWIAATSGEHAGGRGKVMGLSYEDMVMSEIVKSLGAMNLSHRHRDELMAAAAGCGSVESSGCFVDNNNNVSFTGLAAATPGMVENGAEVQQQFFLSLPPPSIGQGPASSLSCDSSSIGSYKNFFSGANSSPIGTESCSGVNSNVQSNMDPDLGWVNDLLM